MTSSNNKPNKFIKKPRHQRSVALMDAVLDSSEKLFATHGFKKTTTNKIAELAGVSIGSVYQYFLNKEFILSILIDRMLASNRTVFVDSLKNNSSDSLEQALEHILDVSLNQFLSKKNFLKIFFNQIHTLNKMEEIYVARRTLAAEMSTVLLAKYSDKVSEVDIENRLFLLFNSYVGSLEAYLQAPEGQISKESLRTHLLELIIKTIITTKPHQ